MSFEKLPWCIAEGGRWEPTLYSLVARMTTAERRGHQAAAAEGEMAALCFPLLVISARTICTIWNTHICTAGRWQEIKKETNRADRRVEAAAEGKMETVCKCWPGRQFISEREGCAALALSGAAGSRAEGLSAADKLWQNLVASSSHNPAEGEPWQKRRVYSLLRNPIPLSTVFVYDSRC